MGGIGLATMITVGVAVLTDVLHPGMIIPSPPVQPRPGGTIGA
ncbi:hypothetical protein [Micromonospora sonneratiae]|uniref:Uncharacterized protein n=1 Tax=Micromonospora sonneratiae TaxID=1184706 RepID=A0ABW3YFR0_9ACTN